jgi:sulfonate transport system substrate-binding protein
MHVPQRRSFLAALAASPFAFHAAARAESAPAVLRIGTTAPGHLKFLLSQQQKFFDKALQSQGTKVEYLAFAGGGSEVQTALASGAIDVAYSGASPALRLAAKKANAKLIGASSVPVAGTVAILVPAHSPLKTLADLKGRKVAYLSGTIRHSVLVKSLRSVGLGVKDIDSLNMPFEASAPALARGDIDALVETNTTVAPLVDKGIARILFDDGAHPEWEIPLLITANGSFAKKYPSTLVKLLQADRQVAEWADSHFDEAVAIYAKAYGTTPAALQKQWPHHRFNDAPRITEQVLVTLKEEEKFMQEASLLNGSVDFATWVDRSYVEAAYGNAPARGNPS